MKIQILDKEITLKNSFRAYIIFENITGKSFQSVETLSDMLCFMYATVLASAKTTDISFEDFMDYIDEHAEVVTQFSQWLMQSHSIINEASNTSIEDDKNPKKKTKRTKS